MLGDRVDPLHVLRNHHTQRLCRKCTAPVKTGAAARSDPVRCISFFLYYFARCSQLLATLQVVDPAEDVMVGVSETLELSRLASAAAAEHHMGMTR
jgi:hypothetical protein